MQAHATGVLLARARNGRAGLLPAAKSGADVGSEVLAGEGGAGGDEVGGSALEDDPAAVVAGAGAQVDDPVGMRHDRLMVLDDDDRLAGVDEPVEQAEQLLDVGEVQAGGRLVEDVDAALLGHVGGQLEPLPLAAGQRSQRLAEAEVAEPDVGEPVEAGCAAGVRASPAPKNSSASVTDIASTSLMSRPPRWYSSTDASNRFPSHSSPEPATPVTTTSTPRGMSTSTSRRLFAVAPRIGRWPLGVRTFSLRVARSSR